MHFLPQESKSSLPKHIPTDEPNENLYSRLLKTNAEARTLLEEQGINSLHLALGAVVWRESETSQQTRTAPLLLIPVALERKEASTEFTTSFTGEETGANASFVEKVRNEQTQGNCSSSLRTKNLTVPDAPSRGIRTVAET